MKWEKYKQMTDAQQKEWKFRFIDKPINMNVTGLVQTMTILLSMITIFVMVSFVVMQSEHQAFDELKKQVPELMSGSTQLVLAMTYVLIAIVGSWAIYLIIRKVREHLWLKKLKEEDKNFWNNE